MQKIRQDCGLGQNIRRIRLNAHMTQDEIAAQLQLAGCDISRSVYAQIECGAYNIRVSELVVLNRLFNVDYNAFFEGVEDGL